MRSTKSEGTAAIGAFVVFYCFWARGTDRLYVHRGTGHYGFPLRLGVPAEQSLLLVSVK